MEKQQKVIIEEQVDKSIDQHEQIEGKTEGTQTELVSEVIKGDKKENLSIEDQLKRLQSAKSLQKYLDKEKQLKRKKEKTRKANKLARKARKRNK